MNGPGSSGTAITYNPASQLTGITRTNVTDLYAWTGHYNINRAYGTNGLNQLTSAGSTALGYDGRGNLTSSGPSVYTYTSENRLATAPGGTTLTYDPTGRLSRVVKGLNGTQFEYLGPRLIIERDAAGTILRRYVHGPGDDEPVVWFENSALTNKRFLHTDERGSVIALSDLSGASTATNKYDEYGIPQSSVGTLAPGTSGRFMYTGQTWIPEVGLYYYKARFYSPTLGRFMQTDPIGYDDGINWYAYVDSDPVNRRDPSGQSWKDVADIVVGGAEVVVGTVGVIVGVVDVAASGVVEVATGGVATPVAVPAAVGGVMLTTASAVVAKNGVDRMTRGLKGVVLEAKRKAPTTRCTSCGARHGGSTETSECPDCDGKRKKGSPVGPRPKSKPHRPTPRHDPVPPKPKPYG